MVSDSARVLPGIACMRVRSITEAADKEDVAWFGNRYRDRFRNVHSRRLSEELRP
jgi:hypothetical protein